MAHPATTNSSNRRSLCSYLALVLSHVIFVVAENGEPTAIRISCGSSHNSLITEQSYLWLKDFGYTGGSSAPIDAKITGAPQLTTLRYFQVSDGPENCYNITVPYGHYLIRFVFAYGDIDNSNREPQFDVSLEGTLVHSLKPGWSAEFDMSCVDSLVFINDGAATACFHSSGHGNPAVVSLEILQIHNLAYEILVPSNKYTILKTVKRISCSAISSGYGADFNADPWGGNRRWVTDNGLTKGTSDQLRTSKSIQNCCGAPNFYPEIIYQSASTTGIGASLYYTFDIEPNQNYSIWLHFAEISDVIVSKEQRVFDILVNDRLIFTDIDIISLAGGPFTALVLNKTVLVEGRTLNLTFRPVQRGILVNAVEIYQVISMEFVTTECEVWSLQALKHSLGLPSRIGWNGDPCVPQEHPWNGLDCSFNVKGGSWSIVGLDLHDQGLKGQIGGAISSLSQLRSVNMSSNSIYGEIPAQVGNLYYLAVL
ncbi:hypothetical protein O6H91_18G007400 [Diphasiastrum complanatum]|nr:hypothetical protein O6H91_18G007400 [Diphasiastrum complanatum]